MTSRYEVEEGQRYVQRMKTAHRLAVWKVGSIHSKAVPIPHARLVNVADPLQTKTISCTTLANKFYYELIAENQAALT